MVTESPKTAPPVSQPGRDRSPPFPFISLRAAVERLGALEATFGRHAAPVDKLGLAWKMKEKSSQALQTAAALKAFGLVDYTGKTENRTVSTSEDGRTYLRAQQDSIKAEVLTRCALKPKAISMCWQRWGADRPPDAVCLDQLILKDKFTDSAAHTLLRVYDETVAFAGLRNTDKVAATGNGGGDGANDVLDPPPLAGKPKVGEFVSWETNGGILMFDARRVLGLSPHGEYVFVEGSQAGLPIQEVTVVSAPANTFTPTPPPNPFVSADQKERSDPLPRPGMKGDIFTFHEGDAHAVFQWPSSMTKDQLEDLESWLQIKLRSIKRSLQ